MFIDLRLCADEILYLNAKPHSLGSVLEVIPVSLDACLKSFN
jgi:hypothetical protein